MRGGWYGASGLCAPFTASSGCSSLYDTPCFIKQAVFFFCLCVCVVYPHAERGCARVRVSLVRASCRRKRLGEGVSGYGSGLAVARVGGELSGPLVVR